MVDATVSQFASGFREHWNQYLQIAPRIVLDDSLPSLAVLDLLTFPLRLKTNLRPEHEIGIRGAASYLAAVIDKCWTPVFDSVSVSLTSDGVTLRAESAEFAPDGEIIVPVEEALRQTLRELPSPFEFSSQWKRPVSFDSNFISLLGIGLLTGLHSSVQGAWAGKTARELQASTDAILREVAKVCADYYARVFPQEPLGQVAELYLRGLLFPPVLADESLPASRAVAGIVEFAKEFKVGKKGLTQLANNLALNPDDALSCAGLALTLALADRVPSPEILAAAFTKGKFIGVLRHSVERVRKHLELSEDWITAGLATSEAKMRFRIDEALTAIPWLSMCMERIEAEQPGSKILTMIRAMSEFELDAAQKICTELVEQNPSDVDVRIQRIRLTMVGGDYEQADSMFRALLSEPGADTYPRFFNLWGLCALELKQVEKARSYFKAALAVIDREAVLRPDLENNLGWVAMLSGDSMGAIEHLESAAASAPCPVTAMLNRVHLLWSVGEQAQAEAVRSALFALAPTDRRVFAGLTIQRRGQNRP